ncbi:MAG TPA: class I SAM-dependent methyltransferase [Geobacterales bacterium]|nr:class I SAM-dependent methyltransferase [Geobacterales bacterium]
MNQQEHPAHQFTNSWFNNLAKGVWDQLITNLNPTTILEIGSYEGASTCYLIDLLAQKKEIEVHCIDSWEGSAEHKSDGTNMSEVEARFLHNTKLSSELAAHNVALAIHKGFSDYHLSKLFSDGKRNYFDFIYIDGSHYASDVICDAVLSFRLLRIGGVIAFDDYLWAGHNIPFGVITDPLGCPKLGIDAFTNLYGNRIRLLSAPLYQIYVQKISD